MKSGTETQTAEKTAYDSRYVHAVWYEGMLRVLDNYDTAVLCAVREMLNIQYRKFKIQNSKFQLLSCVYRRLCAATNRNQRHRHP